VELWTDPDLHGIGATGASSDGSNVTDEIRFGPVGNTRSRHDLRRPHPRFLVGHLRSSVRRGSLLAGGVADGVRCGPRDGRRILDGGLCHRVQLLLCSMRINAGRFGSMPDAGWITGHDTGALRVLTCRDAEPLGCPRGDSRLPHTPRVPTATPAGARPAPPEPGGPRRSAVDGVSTAGLIHARSPGGEFSLRRTWRVVRIGLRLSTEVSEAPRPRRTEGGALLRPCRGLLSCQVGALRVCRGSGSSRRVVGDPLSAPVPGEGSGVVVRWLHLSGCQGRSRKRRDRAQGSHARSGVPTLR
jgi:hypothetical protein